MCVIIHSEWLLNDHSVLHCLTHLFGVIFCFSLFFKLLLLLLAQECMTLFMYMTAVEVSIRPYCTGFVRYYAEPLFLHALTHQHVAMLGGKDAAFVKRLRGNRSALHFLRCIISRLFAGYSDCKSAFQRNLFESDFH